MTITDLSLEEMLGMIESDKRTDPIILKGEEHPLNYFGMLYSKLGLDCFNKLFGGGGIGGLALENAYIHGHKRDGSLPISLEIFKGTKGVVARFGDCGKGFNYKKVQKRFEKNKKYWNNVEGRGFERYNEKEWLVSFEKKGTVINILYYYE